MNKISEFQVGQSVNTTLCVVEASLKDASNGKYLSMVLSDGTDKIDAKVWQYQGDNVPPSGLVVDVTGTVGEYKGKRDINIKSISHNQDIPMEQFLGYDEVKSTKLYRDLMELVYQKVNRYGLNNVTLHILRKYKDELLKGVGAKSVHHDYVGGYLQHISEVVLASIKLGEVAKYMGVEVDESLLISGAILHDLGKLKAYEVNGLKIDASSPGLLIDHMALSIIMIEDAYKSLEFIRDEDYYKLLHIVQSHHGCKEWGSIVEPKFIEAQIIHFADNFSAKIDIMKNVLEKTDKPWSDKVWSLGGITLYKGGDLD